LHRKLAPLYRDRGMRYRGMGEILWQWFGKNRVPHTNWLEGPDDGHPEPAGSASTT
jgi:hypothetical protein